MNENMQTHRGIQMHMKSRQCIRCMHADRQTCRLPIQQHTQNPTADNKSTRTHARICINMSFVRILRFMRPHFTHIVSQLVLTRVSSHKFALTFPHFHISNERFSLVIKKGFYLRDERDSHQPGVPMELNLLRALNFGCM